MTRAFALVLAALVTQGCAAIPVVAAVGVMGAVPDGDEESPGTRAQPDSGPAPQDAVRAANGGLPVLGALPPQDLASGACALFLFTRGAESRFVAFAPSDGAALTLPLDGGAETLAAAAPLAAAPDAFTQTYRSDDGLEARLSATLGDPLPQGRMAPEASLRLSTPQGAAQVMPLSGLLACEDAA